jgi:hypothetical protein
VEDEDEHDVWRGELAHWAQEAVETSPTLGTGEPLRTESVRSLGHVDFLRV